MQQKNVYKLSLLYLLMAGISSGKITAQNVSAPYSILGIGDIETKDLGRYFATGSASLARREIASYNFANPASLTALPIKTMNFDIVTRGRSSRFLLPGADATTGVSKDFAVKRITMAFKLTPKAAVAVGLKPFSTVNYQYNTSQSILDGTSTYKKNIDGSGGINQVYFSGGKTVGKRISIGFTAAWLFGSLTKNTSYIANSIDLLIDKTETDFYTGARFQGGLQYYSLPGKTWQHHLGISATTGSSLKGTLTTVYLENNVEINKDITANRAFKMPMSLAAGYTALLDTKLSLSLEVNYDHWPYQKANFSDAYTGAAMRYALGMEYAEKIKKYNNYEKFYVGWGASLQHNYVRLNGHALLDYAFTFGGGFHLMRGTSLYSGIEIGTRGNNSIGQIKENYTQFIFGITLKDIWLGPKYSRRYD